MKEKTKKGQPSFIFSKYGPIPAYFSFIFILSIIQIEKKRSWCVRDSNPGPHNGRHRLNHGAALPRLIDAVSSIGFLSNVKARVEKSFFQRKEGNLFHHTNANNASVHRVLSRPSQKGLRDKNAIFDNTPHIFR